MKKHLFTAIALSATLMAGQMSQAAWPQLTHLAGELADPLREQAAWEAHDLVLYRSMLSPGALFRMQTPSIRFFGELEAYGAEGPTFFIVKTDKGVEALSLDTPLDGQRMKASWIVASFQDAKGWENFDAPWFIALEKRPQSITLTRAGLEIKFAEPDTGHIFSMPLYGWRKLPQAKKDFCAENKLPGSGLQPWKWKKSVPREVSERCDLWARIARAFPVGFQESFSVDPQKDEITFRNDYRWLITQDDWQTEPLRFATLSPSLGLAWKTPGFPMTFSAAIQDPEYYTPFGPCVGAWDTDRLEIKMQVLQYINELERLEVPAELTPDQAKALKWITGGLWRFGEEWRCFYDHGERNNYCWNIVADVWYMKALAFLEPEQRERVKKSMRVYMAHEVLEASNYTERHGALLLHGPGVGSWGQLGDAGKFSSAALESIWAYAHYANDWGLIRDRWEMIKKLFVTPLEMNWVFFGRGAIAEMGDEAPPCSSYARLGWGAQDQDAYLWGCYAFARELIHHYVKQVGAQYFYERQPNRGLTPMERRVYLSNLWGGMDGWQMDGPCWPRHSGEHQSRNRWVRFHDPDTGRFYRDHLRAEVREELEWYTQSASEGNTNMYDAQNYRNWLKTDQGHILPSLVRLRSFLVGDKYEELSRIVPMTNYGGGIAVGYAYLRSMVPVHYDRIVPQTQDPSPYVLGLERRGQGDHLNVAQALNIKDLKLTPSWAQWPMPQAAAGEKNPPARLFGTISGDFGSEVAGEPGSQWMSYGCLVLWRDALPPSAQTTPEE